jgi:hypothetical protein
MRVVCRRFMFACLMVLSRRFVMPGSMLMMFGCLVMVFRRLL